MNESCIKRVNVSSLLLYCIAGFTGSSRAIITSQAHSLWLGEKKKLLNSWFHYQWKGRQNNRQWRWKSSIRSFHAWCAVCPPHTHTHQINHLFPSTELFLANLSCSQYNCDSWSLCNRSSKPTLVWALPSPILQVLPHPGESEFLSTGMKRQER